MRRVFLLAFCLLAACESAPVTGRSQMMLVSESEERQLGARTYREVLAKEPQSHDVELNALVEKVGRRIADAAEHPPADMWKAPHYNWEFRTIAKNVPNAFCLPGGKVAVYAGILPITRTEAGLATVIGHEVAHALARHSAERLSDQKAVAAGTMLATLGLAVAGGKSGSTYAPMAAAALGAGATVGILLPMSRTQESEADHIGLVLMAMAGYDPREAVGVWERMKARSGGPRTPEWLSTHPADDTRIADIRHWVPEAMRYYRPQGRSARD
ncbi:MAG: M48 family metallopeptidase [Reyranella sp.]|uniref:M48 family metallopeptidase n=1 Tax=Reyranella sp. TaxID=1929291 RepID=UPI001AC423F2|nr:M48 family metallopeptidase [Reyranella sp.]MBN9091353.1 M48 family metallopeptidase [Reyranella sp.]